MRYLFGLLQRDGAPATREPLERMRAALAPAASGGIWLDGPIGLGQVAPPAWRAPAGEWQPCRDTERGIVLSAAARVDNREELLQRLADPGRPPVGDDADLILRAYSRWGEACPERIYGDWAFAAWHRAERRLFLARDHFGITALYYYADARVFAFASDRRALLALDLAPVTMDELYVAQVLISWQAYHGERTTHTPIRRLPPAHTLTVTPERLDVRQYWFLEQTPELRLPRREDYVAAFREVFDEAVRARLRPPDGAAQAGIGVTLSGGLDSSSVTATAAAMLAAEGRRLTAYTSVPLGDTAPYVGKAFGDEQPLAQATAQRCGNVDLQAIAADVAPLAAIRRQLQIQQEPGHAAGNAYWLIDMERTAAAHCSVLLTGQCGNAGISWTGDPLSQPLAFQVHLWGWRRCAKEQAKHHLPRSLARAYQRLRTPADWYSTTAINPAFAARLHLLERRLSDPDEWPRTALEQRLFLKPGRSMAGALHAQMAAAHGLEIRDPTADARVLAFTFSVPDRLFIDPDTGMGRWLIRAAMAGRVPDEVRLNRRRGSQAGDLVPRMRAYAAEMEAALAELAAGPAADYLDVPNMRQAWQVVQTEDTARAFQRASSILTRGVMAGWFINGFPGPFA